MRVNKLSPSERVKGRWLVYLEDNSILRVSENEVLSFALYAGMELDGETHAALVQAAQKSAVLEKALSLLSIRPMSRKELLKKLADKEFDSNESEAVADRLEELGYLNDREFANTVVRHYSAKGYGPRKLQDELYRRGVPRAYWDEALSEAKESDSSIDAFLMQKLRGTVPDRKEIKRVSDALARRGYRWDEISAGLRRYGAEISDD